MAETVLIPGSFNGPAESGQGGYTAGALAALVGSGPVEVTLRSPVPLDRPLAIERGDGGAVRARDGERLIAEARAVPELELEVPAPVAPERAREATTRYRGLADGMFSRCFVCGRAREDTLGVFAGPVEGRDLVASPWTPPAWTAGGDRLVRPEFVWAVLDCPTFFAAYLAAEQLPISFLGRLTARLDAPVAVGEEHVVTAWPLAVDGRKREAGSAVLTAGGDVLAVARALMIEPRSAPGPG